MPGAIRALVTPVAVRGVFAAVTLVAPAVRAQLRDPIPADQIADGVSLRTAAGILGDAGGERDAQLVGELATVLAWTRGGIDETEGFRGPRWTNRWGLVLEGRASAGSRDRALVAEQRAELALYAISIGETVTWGARPRMTDELWRRDPDRAVLGTFVEFFGLGLVHRQDDDVVGIEALPISLSIAGDRDVHTVEFEAAAARAAGQSGDVRLIDHRITVRDQLGLKSIAWDFSAISARDVALAAGSPWRLSGAIGLGVLIPFKPDSPERFEALASVIPLARLGLAHHGAARLRTARSDRPPAARRARRRRRARHPPPAGRRRWSRRGRPAHGLGRPHPLPRRCAAHRVDARCRRTSVPPRAEHLGRRWRGDLARPHRAGPCRRARPRPWRRSARGGRALGARRSHRCSPLAGQCAKRPVLARRVA